MTQLLPAADLYVASNAATLKALGATSVTPTGADTVDVMFSDITQKFNAKAVLSDAVRGAKITFSVGVSDGGLPIVDAVSAAQFLKQHPGVVDVVRYDGLDERPLIVPGTVDGPTAHALAAIMKPTSEQDASPFVLISPRPADATPTTPIDPELPTPTPIG